MTNRDSILKALRARKQRGVHYSASAAVDLLANYRNEVLDGAADFIRSGLVREPSDDVDRHVNDVLERMAADVQSLGQMERVL